MYVIFLMPLVVSVVAAFMFLGSESNWITKAFVVLVVAAAVAMQFVPVLATSVHFLVPLFMELFICGWWYFAHLMEDM